MCVEMCQEQLNEVTSQRADLGFQAYVAGALAILPAFLTFEDLDLGFLCFGFVLLVLFFI